MNDDKYKFNIGDEVKIISLSEYDDSRYKIGKILKVRKRDFVKNIDTEPLYWLGNKRFFSHLGLYESQLEATRKKEVK